MTSNTLRFGQDATIPWDVIYPRKKPEEIKEPGIRSRSTHGLTNKQMELALTAERPNYEVFIHAKPTNKMKKKKTCFVNPPSIQSFPRKRT